MISNANIEILEQLKFVLLQINGIDYKKALKVLNMSTIGQHNRHIIEFYQCLFDGIETNIVDYDARNRDLKIESDLDYAIGEIDRIILNLDSCNFDSSVTLKMSFGYHQISLVSTTFQRELTYLLEHTIHHLAIIKIALDHSFTNITIPANFGIAFSTIAYKQINTLTA
jgi:hypothetical protein